MAFPNNARLQYLKTQVETASKEQLVVMLFDGILRFTENARKALEEKRIEDSHNALLRAQAIVMELIVTVDKEKGGEIAQNLLGLHAYAFNCLVQCNMHRDVAKIDEVQNIYRQIRQGWVGAMENLGIVSNSANAAPAAPASAPQKPTAAKPVFPLPPKPLGSAPLGKSSPGAQSPAPGDGSTGGNGGFLAANAQPATTAKPVISPVTGYGMGRSAGLGAPDAIPVRTAMPQAAAKPAVPNASLASPAVPPAPAVTPVARPALSAQQAAMLNAYQNNSKSIA